MGDDTYRVTALRDDLPDVRPEHTVDLAAAEDFLRRFHRVRPQAGQVDTRIAQVRAEVAATGSYRHTKAELAYGARMAVRESGWCPRTVGWRDVLVRDLRAVREPAAVATECLKHLRMAAGNGVVTPVVTVFAKDAPRIRNDHLVRYAGYQEEGGVLGDRRYVDFTAGVTRLGWRPPAKRTAFDLLPLVIENAGQPLLFPIPRESVCEVPLSHPDLPWFGELGLRWHAVPAIANLRLRIGGVEYPSAPFNGVYLCQAIGEDVLADEVGYGMAHTVAKRLGLDVTSERSLWRERAAVELNRAVLHSFDAAGVRMEHTSQAYLPMPGDQDGPAFVRT
ncbi:nitric-oxide synthase [Labedaea rhizosphaerae]|uniref:Nitric-oxide synthase n=1 Tax=Labedaea rhizosphaerae TaxID=598644 RepID=A0A4V3D0C5_LABRH|nr:nitric-oxide synthase [Labedaea rhizosphaerae]